MRRAHKIWVFYNLERRKEVILLDAIVISKRMLTKTVAEFILKLPYGYPKAEPGQFVKVRCEGFLLSRPISICWSNENKKPEICLIVESRGSGTTWLVNQNPGTKLDISSPLGNGFNVFAEKRYLIIGGGIGIPPLLSVIKKVNWNADSILCFTTSKKVMMEDDFCAQGSILIVATDDGSYGLKGRADEILRDHLIHTSYDYEAILACGPKPMLAAVAKLAEEFNIPCQVSLEEYMACGIGACKGCAVQLTTGMGTVCRDGPVFNSKEVIWDA